MELLLVMLSDMELEAQFEMLSDTRLELTVVMLSDLGLEAPNWVLHIFPLMVLRLAFD